MSQLGTFVWGIADALRGPYKPHQYGDVILPMTILRRLDAILAPTRDEVATLVAANPTAEIAAARIKQQLGLGFHNTSPWTFSKLLGDPEGLAANMVDYLAGFSANIDVFERFKFEQTIGELDEKDRLLIVVQAFAKVDLTPDAVDNAAMGDLFEELIRKFADASNETAGEHFTPRDAIGLMVDLLFAGDDEALTSSGVVRTVYDPTAGTGGMLSIADEHLRKLNPDAQLNLYGQEINAQSYAICKSDMIAKGQTAENIKLGDTLVDDHFADRTFDYCLSNPPYGVDWKASQAAVKADVQDKGEASRFHAGLPAVSDGQMLFLQHLVSKMRPVKDGGGRAGIVLNGSPLFNGAAESGPSKIRRWLLESDLVDAIVALPTEMFYNTGIATYIWILDNNKPTERVGKVQLIDGTDFYAKMRKSLGSKRREIIPAQRDELVKLYAAHVEGEKSKIFDTAEFGYWTITVERPLLDEDGNAVTDRKGNPKPDPKLRDTENVPFTYAPPAGRADSDGRADSAGRACRDPRAPADRDATIDAYMAAEVLPHVPDAWIDPKKTKVGYEIPFTRHFYTYVPPRPLAEIDADLEAQVAKILTLLRGVEA